jgi:hypothetical protein
MKMVHFYQYVYGFLYNLYLQPLGANQYTSVAISQYVYGFFNIIFRSWEQTSKLVLLVKYEDNATDVFDEITSIYVVSITTLVLVRTHVVLFYIYIGCVYFLKKKSIVQTKDSHHIKLTIHVWSNKCR